jgi:hypothetical protein
VSQAAPAANIDQRLVGRWLNTETYVSGDVSFATDTWFILNADGTYEYGHKKTAGGGMAGSIVGERGDAETGHWRAEDKQLLLRDPSTGNWTPVARYALDGGTMMLTYGNGNKKIWYRQ